MIVINQKLWKILALAFVIIMTMSDALMIGRRRIKCSTPIGGTETDCLMDSRPNIPGIIGFVGAQAVIPSLGKCPIESQLQPPWFLGNSDAGGGLCPPEFWNIGALVPGILIISIAIVLNQYFVSNRLLITDSSIGLADPEALKDQVTGLESFRDIDTWFMTPVGLVLKLNSGGYKIFPLAWDQKSVEAVLEDRL